MDCRVIMIVNMGYFQEYANGIKMSLEELGHTASVTEYLDDIGDLNIVTKAFRPFDITQSAKKWVNYQSEELHNRREKGHYDLSNGWPWVLEMFKENTSGMTGLDKVRYCPYGYSPAFETDLPQVDEDIDLLFFGHHSPDRKAWFRQIQDSPILNKRSIVVIDDENPVFGRERDELIMRSKIVLNFKVQGFWFYAPLRGLITQCKKKLYMIEKPDGGYDPYIPDVHFKEFTTFDNFVEQVEYWLDHDKERNEFAVNAYEDIKEKYRWSQFIERGLREYL
jgi:hypothetical protein